MKISVQLDKFHEAILIVLSNANYEGIKEWELENVLNIFFENSLEYKKDITILDFSKIYFGTNFKIDKNNNRIESELPAYVNFLEQAGLIKITSDISTFVLNYNDAPKIYKLSEEGERISKLVKLGRKIKIRKPKDERTKVFFACAFGYPETEKLFKQIKQSCSRIGLEAIRIDYIETNQTITDALIEEIYESKLLIADLSFARPSVYFEVGIAQALGMSCILTCREDHLNSTIDNLKIHFDLAQYKISLWKFENNKIIWNDRKMKPINRIKNAL